jgi:hypothetical protein
MKQIEDKPKEEVKEPTLPVFIPMRIVRWILYSFIFMLLLVPFVQGLRYDGAKAACGGLIMGWFASQLNALINKKP